MQFMNQEQALSLLELMKHQARNGLNIEVNGIFPATELKFNRDLYPGDAYLVDMTWIGKDYRSQNWIQSEEHWNTILKGR